MAVMEKVKLPSPVSALLNWSRKYSLWCMQFGLACCGIEMGAAFASKFDVIRFGVIPFPASPRQADLLVVDGPPADLVPAVQAVAEEGHDGGEQLGVARGGVGTADEPATVGRRGDGAGPLVARTAQQGGLDLGGALAALGDEAAEVVLHLDDAVAHLLAHVAKALLERDRP